MVGRMALLNKSCASPRRPVEVVVLLSSLLLLGVGMPRGHAQGDFRSGFQRTAATESKHFEESLALHRTWTSAFSLHSRIPPPTISLPSPLPPAPHLQDCVALTALRHKLEARQDRQQGKEGVSDDHAAAPPPWAVTAKCSLCLPQPPWVRGSDSSNLALTRVTQADLWLHQFPATCVGRKLLVQAWPSNAGSLAEQFSLMSVALSVAVYHGAILVPYPGSYQPANHEGCEGIGHANSSTCYFFPVTSPECESLAAHAIESGEAAEAETQEQLQLLLAANTGGAAGTPAAGGGAAAAADGGGGGSGSTTSTAADEQQPGWAAGRVVVNRVALNENMMEERVVSKWGVPHRLRPNTVEVRGTVPQPSSGEEKEMEREWFRAQAVRFFLRWPSSYLCHVMNRERHAAYGFRLAAELVSSQQQQRELIQEMASGEEQGSVEGLNGPAEAQAMQQLSLQVSKGDAPTLESGLWQWGEAYSGCCNELRLDSEGVMAVPSQGSLDVSPAMAVKEAYLPRPIVSLHVDGQGRQGDGGVWDYLLQLYRLRGQEPGLKYVWLTADNQSAFNKASGLHDWVFLHTLGLPEAEQQAVSSPNGHVTPLELHLSTGIGLAGILIASQSDYFIGALRSSSTRLVNDLRLTNGRLFSGLVSIQGA